MANVFKEKISIKVALIVNLLLLIILAIGSVYMINLQSKSLEHQMYEKAKMESILGAKGIGRIIDEGIDNGVLTVADAFDQQYVRIPQFEPPKYHTQYDFYFDKAILSFEDEFLKDESVVFAVAVDTNGYLPTHNTRFQQPITNDEEKDLLGNRTKRIFNDPVGLKAAKNEEEGLLQIYHRDTGEVMWDVSTPIYVKGKHWGGFRIGFSLVAVDKAKKHLAVTLVTIMLVILIFSMVTIFVVVDKALSPLSHFTKVASELADGKVDEKIESKSQDEIGKLADVLERLRVSLKAAMDRLKRK